MVDGRRALLGLVCLAGILLACGGGEKQAASDDDIPFPETQAFSEEETARLHEIRDHVARIRGVEINPEVEEGIVKAEDLRRYIEVAFASLDGEDRADLRTYEMVWKLLRMIEPDVNLEKALISSNSDSVAGLYVAKEKRLAIVDDQRDGDMFEEFIYAHEYVHSFQDRMIDLVAYHEKEQEAESTELSTTMSCVVEGDASLAAVHYMNDKYGGPGWTEDLGGDEEEEESDIPPALQRYEEFDYSECLTFMVVIHSLQGWEGVNKLLREPPLSTEQILHPEKYIAGEGPQAVSLEPMDDVLGSEWKSLDEVEYGEFDVYNYLLTVGVGEREARGGSRGWGGGKMHVYSRGGDKPKDVLVHIGLQWDTPGDLAEFRQHFGWAIDNLGYDAVSRRSNDGSWTWSSRREYAYATWSDASQRVDILFSTDQVALIKARDTLRVAATTP